MYSVSSNNIIAFTPLLPVTTTKCTLQLTNLDQTVQLSIDLPGSYNQAIVTSKYSYDWFLDPNDYDEEKPQQEETKTTQPTEITSTTPKAKIQIQPKKEKKIVIPAHIMAVNKKKAECNPFVRGLSWNHQGDFLAISLDSYIVLFYQFTQTSTSFECTLHTVIGLPRHLGFITMTPNGKNWLISDTIGDVYGLPHSQVLTNNQAQQSSLLFSVSAYCTQLITTNVEQSDQNNQTKFLDLLVASDVEGKIRVSNLPNFFDIQSYCMGSPCVPTSQCMIINNKFQEQNMPSRLLFTSTPKGHMRKCVSDPYSPWKPYDPLQTSMTLHNLLNAELLIQPTDITHPAETFPDQRATQQTATVYIGAGPLFNPATNNTLVYVSPSLMTCGLDHNGHLNPSIPLTQRTSLHNITSICINPTEKTHTTAHNVKIEGIPADYDANVDLVHFVASFDDTQSKITIQTTTNKLFILESISQDDTPGLRVVNAYNFGIVDFSTITPPQKNIKQIEVSELYNIIHYSVAKYLNFHWRFERAPTREAAHKRQHLTSLANDDDDDDDDDDENRLVQLGQASPIKQ